TNRSLGVFAIEERATLAVLVETPGGTRDRTTMVTAAAQKTTPNQSQPHRSLARSISRGTLFSFIANLVRYGTRLVLVSLFVARLGLDGYGIWATLMVIAGYLRFGSGAVKACFQKYVAEAHTKGDFEHANQLVTTGTAIFFAMSAAVLVPVAVFPRFLAHLVGIPAQYMSASATAITLISIAYLLSNTMGVFEAAVLGVHRVDLMQYFNVAVMIFDLTFYAVVLGLGYGLGALALGMAIGELGYALSGLLLARRVIPQICLRPRYLTTKVIPELVRFTGSYQLQNIMEMFYVGLVPIVLLREIGAGAVGVFAICDRLTRFATMGLEASFVPLLSGSTMIFSLGSPDRMRAFLSKAFKMSLIATMLPLALASLFGPAAVLAWTGQTNSFFRLGICLVAVAAFFRSLAKVGMVLYRSTGGASMDNAAELLRILILLLVVILGKQWGFYGALAGLALAELAGMTFMLEALFRRLGCYSLSQLAGQAAHLFVPVLILILAAEAVARAPVFLHAGSRLFLSLRLAIVSLMMLVLAWPVFILTKCFSLDERTQILAMLLPWRRAAKPA
ncbi:MAG: hypothetical protein WCA20_06935, partial [Candidatus Sulfotelmatobacter sp.]